MRKRSGFICLEVVDKDGNHNDVWVAIDKIKFIEQENEGRCFLVITNDLAFRVRSDCETILDIIEDTLSTDDFEDD